MSESFFNFAADPFAEVGESAAYFDNASAREAKASLLHGIKSRKGFIVLIGSAGTGKTTLLRHVAEQIDQDTQVVCVFDSGVSFEELLEFICIKLGVDTSDRRRLALLEKLNRHLLTAATARCNVVVMIDDAHAMDDGFLEQLRLLTNFETPTEKILQIVLSGRPELDSRLNGPALKQLHQRVGLRAVLEPLRSEEVADYVAARLAEVGTESDAVFSARALGRLANASAGLPRRINNLCATAISIAAKAGEHPVSVAVMKQAIRDCRGGDPMGDSGAGIGGVIGHPASWVAATGLALMAAAFGVAMRGPGLHAVTERSVAESKSLPHARTGEALTGVSATDGQEVTGGQEMDPPGPQPQRVTRDGGEASADAADSGRPQVPVVVVPSPEPQCGNGRIEPGEECDDGNRSNTDSCLTTCRRARCGDGYLRTGVEQCDDGVANSDTVSDRCRSDCRLPRCGDGVIDGDEDCDDGNADNTDKCLDVCVGARCGDGFIRTGVEQCDDGLENSDSAMDACRRDCRQAHCGDGVVDRFEICDDGNADEADGCPNNCRFVIRSKQLSDLAPEHEAEVGAVDEAPARPPAPLPKSVKRGPHSPSSAMWRRLGRNTRSAASEYCVPSATVACPPEAALGR